MPFGNLLDEAERAGVFANANPIECWIGEGDAPEFVACQLQVESTPAIAAHDLDPDRLRLRVELEIERIEDRHAIDRRDAIAHEQADLLGERIRLDCFDHAGHGRGKVNPLQGNGTDYWHLESGNFRKSDDRAPAANA